MAKPISATAVRNIEQDIERLKHQIVACHESAAKASGDVERVTLEGAARSLERQLLVCQQRLVGGEYTLLQVVSDDATPRELGLARRKGPVLRADETYLPWWRQFAVGMPHAFMRGSLFAPVSYKDDKDRPQHKSATIYEQGDVSLKFTGEGLDELDCRVLAACLEYYRDRPLSRDSDNPVWIKKTAAEFMRNFMGLTYHPVTHKRIRDSLLRLSHGSLSLRVRCNDRYLTLPTPKLLDAAFYDGAADDDCLVAPEDQFRSRDIIAFRVSAALASYFAPEQWSSIPYPALFDQTGFAAMWSRIFATHDSPHPIITPNVLKATGFKGTIGQFNDKTREAFARLSRPGTDAAIRMIGYSVDEKNISGDLARWQEGAPATKLRSVKAKTKIKEARLAIGSDEAKAKAQKAQARQEREKARLAERYLQAKALKAATDALAKLPTKPAPKTI